MLSNMLMLMGKQVYSLCETRDHRTTVNEIICEEGETFFSPNAIYVLMGKHIAWDTFLDEFLWDAKIRELLPVIAFEPSQATNYIIILAKYIDIVWTISQQTWKMLT